MMATKADKEMEAKLKARQQAKVRPDEPERDKNLFEHAKEKGCQNSCKETSCKEKSN